MIFRMFNKLFGNKEMEEKIITIETPSSVIRQQTKSLFISAGHSDTDPGAKGNGYSEADIVLEFRNMLAKELTSVDVSFSKDGEKNQNLPLRTAITLAKTKDLAIEFHCNAFTNPTATGVETLSSNRHIPFCDKLNAVIAETLGIRNRGSKGEASGQHSRLGFISQADGIIVELFFISNLEDVKKYQNNKELLAKRVAQLLKDEVYAT